LNDFELNNTFKKELHLLQIYYKQLCNLLNSFFSGYLLIHDDEINKTYFRLCNRIEKILEEEGFENLSLMRWRPFDNLRSLDPDAPDLEWEYGGQQICGNFLSEIEDLFIRTGEKTYLLEIENKKFLNQIQNFLEEYLKYKKSYENKWLEKVEEKAKKWRQRWENDVAKENKTKNIIKNKELKSINIKNKKIYKNIDDIDGKIRNLVLELLYEINQEKPSYKVSFDIIHQFLNNPSRNLSKILNSSMLERNLIFLKENKWIQFSRYVGRPKNIYITQKGIEYYLEPKYQYYSCFISYGKPDKDFTEKLISDLEAKGVSCWLYSLDATPGERIWREIGRKRREADKMIVLCSANSLIRDGILKEIEEQIDENPDKIIPISLDNLWKERGFRVMRAFRDLKPFLMDRNYADFSDLSKYETWFCPICV